MVLPIGGNGVHCYFFVINLVHRSFYNWTVYELLLDSDSDYFRRLEGSVSPVLLRRRQHCSCA